MKFIDNLLNRITMYRLVLYVLIAFIAIATIFSFLHILPYDPIALLFTTTLLVVFSWIANMIFSKVYNAPTNVESVYITALILACIINLMKSYHDLPFVFFAALLAMASKYILAIGKKHIFNPVAIAVVLTSIGFGGTASWWIGNLPMMPFVVLGGFLITRKIRREDLVYTFICVAVIIVCIFSFLKGSDILTTLNTVLLHSSLFFFAFVMLTEPLTSPPTKNLQMAYSVITAILFVPQVHIGSLYFSPEEALCIGNVFSYLVSPKYKLMLYAKEKLKLNSDTYDFIFPLQKRLTFIPGQYMEWTMPHNPTDDRGNRRYFTIASSPTEDTLRIGIKYYEPPSSFKKALVAMDEKTPIVATGLAGDFTLPKDASKKLVFIAGGIGITPFRSILKYLVDTNQKRDVILFYSNKYASEIVYKDVFDQATTVLGTKVIYTITDITAAPPEWTGKKGRINGEMIMNEVPDYKERTFYLSGPHAMVTAYQDVLKAIGVPNDHIKVDFFPGFV